MIMELFSLGSLNDYLHSGTPKFRQLIWPIRVRIALDIAKAMEYLHTEDVIHRDLRSPNILVNSFSEDADPLVKVGDFGMSVVRFHFQTCCLGIDVSRTFRLDLCSWCCWW